MVLEPMRLTVSDLRPELARYGDWFAATTLGLPRRSSLVEP